MLDKVTRIVQMGTLAPNGHNTQPWKFTVNESEIQIHPDFSRHLAQVDPEDREIWISLGAVLENILHAAAAEGFDTQVTYPLESDFIDVRLTGASLQKDPLYAFIPLRANTRSMYDGTPVPGAQLDTLRDLPVEPGVGLRLIQFPSEQENLIDLLNRANLVQYSNKDFIAELLHWLRFNPAEEHATRDGLSSASFGNPPIPRWIGKRVVTATRPGQWAKQDAKKVRSSSGAVVIYSDRDDRVTWVRTGQVYERLALTLTSLGIQSALLNQPIEVASVRQEMRSTFKLGSLYPQLLLRFGYGKPVHRSIRRPVEEVMVATADTLQAVQP